MSLTYVILGAPASASAELALNLRDELHPDEGAPLIVAAESFREALGEVAETRFWTAGEIPPPLGEDDAARPVFFLPPAQTDPRPFIEDLRRWLEHHDRLLSRLFTVVDCAALEADPSQVPYYDLCLHFSDVFLLGNRQDVSKKWIQDYRKRLDKLAVPTLIDLLKKGGRVADAPGLLYPEARRLTQFLDPLDKEPELPIEIEGYGADEEIADPRDPQLDPYLERGEDQRYKFKLRI